MGSKTYDGVWFTTYSHDHAPPHVHGSYAEAVVVVDLMPDGTVAKSARSDAVQPVNAKRSDVKHILVIAAENAAELLKLWENTHGAA